MTLDRSGTLQSPWLGPATPPAGTMSRCWFKPSRIKALPVGSCPNPCAAVLAEELPSLFFSFQLLFFLFSLLRARKWCGRLWASGGFEWECCWVCISFFHKTHPRQYTCYTENCWLFYRELSCSRETQISSAKYKTVGNTRTYCFSNERTNPNLQFVTTSL